MEGITILNEITVKAAPNWTILLLLIPTIAMMACWIITIITNFEFTSIAALYCLGLLAIGMIITAILGSNTYDHTEYQVLIDENVSLTEFNEKYEIIDKDGEIYTIKEWKD